MRAASRRRAASSRPCGERGTAAEQLHAVRAQQREQAWQLTLVQVEAPDGADVLEQALAVRARETGASGPKRGITRHSQTSRNTPQRYQRSGGVLTNQPRIDAVSRWRIRNTSPGSLASVIWASSSA